MREESKVNSKIGEIRLMKCGEECEIVEHASHKDMVVKFLKTGELVKCRYEHFKRGLIKSHFTPTVFGVGVTGLENARDNNRNIIKSYEVWQHILERCYNKKCQEKRPSYKDCVVCEEWLYYPKFKQWYEKNYYEIEGQRMELDKDILNKGNKVYSPDTCVFVPKSINSLFTRCNRSRGNLPIGVHWHKQKKKYQAKYSIFDITIGRSKVKHLGYHNTPEETFQSYKKAKEDNIKQVADHYKDKIPKKLYKAMYSYEVHIDD
ncbi:hypothetical protein ACSXEK_16280 (plasmid) [Clostridium perfringens]